MSKLNETKLEELCVLNELENSILSEGKIELAEDGFSPAEEDRARLVEFNRLQDKYSYGWYIAQESREEQIKGINKFKEFIINTEEKELSTITIKNDREQTIAELKVDGNFYIKEEEEIQQGCSIHQIIGTLNDYIVILNADTNSLSHVSTELLLEELKSRCNCD